MHRKLSERLVSNSIAFLLLISEGKSWFEAIRKATGCRDRDALAECLEFLEKAGLTRSVKQSGHKQKRPYVLTPQGHYVTDFIRKKTACDSKYNSFREAFASVFQIVEGDSETVKRKLQVRREKCTPDAYLYHRKMAQDAEGQCIMMLSHALHGKFMWLTYNGDLNPNAKELLTSIYMRFVSKTSMGESTTARYNFSSLISDIRELVGSFEDSIDSGLYGNPVHQQIQNLVEAITDVNGISSTHQRIRRDKGKYPISSEPRFGMGRTTRYILTRGSQANGN